MPTPTIDTIISWAQKVSGRTYLIEREMNSPGRAQSPRGGGTGGNTSPPALVLAGDDVVAHDARRDLGGSIGLVHDVQSLRRARTR